MYGLMRGKADTRQDMQLFSHVWRNPETEVSCSLNPASSFSTLPVISFQGGFSAGSLVSVNKDYGSEERLATAQFTEVLPIAARFLSKPPARWVGEHCKDYAQMPVLDSLTSGG